MLVIRQFSTVFLLISILSHAVESCKKAQITCSKIILQLLIHNDFFFFKDSWSRNWGQVSACPGTALYEVGAPVPAAILGDEQIAHQGARVNPQGYEVRGFIRTGEGQRSCPCTWRRWMEGRRLREGKSGRKQTPQKRDFKSLMNRFALSVGEYIFIAWVFTCETTSSSAGSRFHRHWPLTSLQVKQQTSLIREEPGARYRTRSCRSSSCRSNCSGRYNLACCSDLEHLEVVDVRSESSAQKH